MTKETKIALEYIDSVLSKGGDTASELWSVLTALRGPDDGSLEAKDATTALIRGKAFPKTMAVLNDPERREMPVPASMRNPTQEALDRTARTRANSNNGIDPLGDSWHFEHHARSAFIVLGMLWGNQED